MSEQVRADLRYAIRRALKRKWVSLAVLAAIALGTGATAALFTVVDRILLRSLPIAEPEQAYWVRTSVEGRMRRGLNPGDAFDLHARATSFAAMASFNESEATIRVGDDGRPERVGIALVQPAMLEALGIAPMLGQFFGPDDYGVPSPNVIITNRLWRRVFNADRAVIGRTLFMNNVARTVIGVLPPAADVLPNADAEAWRPLNDDPEQRTRPRTATFLTGIARLKPGVSQAAGQADVDRMAAQMATEFPVTNGNRHFVLQPLQDGIVGPAKPTFWLLGAATFMILLIACTSVANLLVTRSHERAHELAVRAALGGRTIRLVQQVLTETALLVLTGGAIGLLLSPLLLKGFVSLYPGGVPRAAELSPDPRTLALSFGAILAAALLASLPAIRRTFALDLNTQLRGDARSGGRRGTGKVAGALVVGQLALSIVLLFGGALLMNTYSRLAAVDPGFDTEHILTLDVTPAASKYSSTELVDAYYEGLFERLHGIPGVKAAASGSLIPFGPNEWSEGFVREGKGDPTTPSQFAKFQIVSSEFFAAVGLTLAQGRFLERTDRDSTPPVIVVNEALVRQYYPGENPLGTRIVLRNKPYEVVGVVRDKRHASLKDPPVPELYVSRAQLQRQLASWVVVRSVGDPALLVPAVRKVVSELDPLIPVAHVATMHERRFGVIAAERFRAVCVGAFALLALVLATIGLYGVVSYTVAQRTREIGLRVALGQEPRSVRWNVIRGAMGYCGIGLVVGVGGALAAGRMMQSLLTGTSPNDLSAMGAVIGLFAAIALVAAYIPARRASAVDPMVVLRNE